MLMLNDYLGDRHGAIPVQGYNAQLTGEQRFYIAAIRQIWKDYHSRDTLTQHEAEIDVERALPSMAERLGLEYYPLAKMIREIPYTGEAPRKKERPKAAEYTWDGRTMTACDWAKELEISHNAFYCRIRQNGICERTFKVGRNKVNYGRYS
jgi:hypothetical protein